MKPKTGTVKAGTIGRPKAATARPKIATAKPRAATTKPRAARPKPSTQRPPVAIRRQVPPLTLAAPQRSSSDRDYGSLLGGLIR